MRFKTFGIAFTLAAAFAVAVPPAAFAQSSGRVIKRGESTRGESTRGGSTRGESGHVVNPQPDPYEQDQTNAIAPQGVWVRPGNGTPGTDVRLKGWGFQPGASVTVLVGQSPTRLTVAGNATVNGDGEVRVDAQVPSWVRPGTSVYFAFRSSNQRNSVVSQPFYVTGN